MRKQGKQNTNSTDFCTVWKVKADSAIKFNTRGLHTIDWGDGTAEEVNTEQGVKHTYLKKGEYTVRIGPG